MRSRLIKMLSAREMQSVMENGEHGGSQRWQLTIIHLAQQMCERKLLRSLAGSYAGLHFILQKETEMDKIQQCALNFLGLVNSASYIFHVANKNVYVISLDFTEKDFYHLAGFQYLTDISIPKNRKETLSWILNKDKPVTDGYLEQSRFYKGKRNDEKDIEKRIANLMFLEQYLDTENIIRIYSPNAGPKNNSLIKCDYIIESRLPSSSDTVYIFLKHRSGDGSPCAVISFVVKKNVSYGGQILYWMLKDKIKNGHRRTIYQHPNYTSEQKIKNEPACLIDLKQYEKLL